MRPSIEKNELPMSAFLRNDGVRGSQLRPSGGGRALSARPLEVALAVEAANRFRHRPEAGGEDLAAAVDAGPVGARGERAARLVDAALFLVQEDVSRRLELLLEGLRPLVAGMVVDVSELAFEHVLARPVHRRARAAELLEPVLEGALHLLSIEAGHRSGPASAGRWAEYVARARRVAPRARPGGCGGPRPTLAPAGTCIGSRADAAGRRRLGHHPLPTARARRGERNHPRLSVRHLRRRAHGERGRDGRLRRLLRRALPQRAAADDLAAVGGRLSRRLRTAPGRG